MIKPAKAFRNELTWPQKTVNWILLTIVFLTMIIPMLNVLAVSFSTDYDSMAPGITLIPKTFSTVGYTFIWRTKNLGQAFQNSLFVSVVATFIQVVISSMAGYVLIQRQLPFRKAMASLILFTMMIPGDLTLISMFSLNKSLGLINTYRGLIINGLVSGFSIMLMRNYFLSVPESLAESGRIDNASEMRIFTSIYLPLSLPGLTAVTFLEFVNKWNAFMIPLIITTESRLYTLPIILRQITQSTDGTSGTDFLAPNAKMAAIIITIIPLVLIYTFAQRFLIGGLTVGATKG